MGSNYTKDKSTNSKFSLSLKQVEINFIFSTFFVQGKPALLIGAMQETSSLCIQENTWSHIAFVYDFDAKQSVSF
jgi:hypothetical protein